MALIGKFKAKKSKKPKKYFNPIAFFCKTCCTKQVITKNEFSNLQALVWLAFIYFWVGSYVYHWTAAGSRSFGVLDQCYFLVVTMTTVGYGDITPDATPQARMFTVLWVLYGVGVVALLLVEVGSMVIDARDALAAKTRAALLKAGAPSAPGAEEEDLDPEAVARLQEIEAKKEAAPSRNPFVRAVQLFPILEVVLYLAAYALVAGWLFTLVEADAGWTLIDGVYYAVITGTSIGYGDIYPVTNLGKGLAIVYLPLAVVFTSTQLSEVGPKVFGAADDDKLSKLMEVDLSLEALLAMDDDGDGALSEFEFLRFMLVQGGMVDKGILDSLHERFAAMDEDGSGALTAEDLKQQPFGLKATVEAGAVRKAMQEWRHEAHALSLERGAMQRLKSRTQSLSAAKIERKPKTVVPATAAAAGAEAEAAGVGGGVLGSLDVHGFGTAQKQADLVARDGAAAAQRAQAEAALAEETHARQQPPAVEATAAREREVAAATAAAAATEAADDRAKSAQRSDPVTEGFLDGAFGNASDALGGAFTFASGAMASGSNMASNPLDGLPSLPSGSNMPTLPDLPAGLAAPTVEGLSQGLSSLSQAMPRLSDIDLGLDMPELDDLMPEMPDVLPASMFGMFGGKDLNAVATEEAADLIWERMREYMKEKGNARAAELFKEMDKDRSGKIDADEFLAALDRMGIQGVSKKVAKAVMKTVDPNGDGQLEYKEILPMLKKPRKPAAQAAPAPAPAFPAGAGGEDDADAGDEVDYNSMPTAQAADLVWEKMRLYMKEKGGQRATELFKEMDKDRSGKIDADEFMLALARMGVRGVSKKAAKKIIKTVDPNGDGQLEYKEILPMLKTPRAGSKGGTRI